MKHAALVLLIAYTLALVVSTHIPTPPEVLVPKLSDKWLHLVAYAGLAFLVCVNWWLRWPLGWRQGAAILACVAVFAALDQVTQIPCNRTADVLDWAADLIGAAIVVGLFLAGAALYRGYRGDDELARERAAS